MHANQCSIQQAHDVEMMWHGHRCDIIALHQRQYDIIFRACAKGKVVNRIQKMQMDAQGVYTLIRLLL